MKEETKKFTRRSFVGTTGAAIAGLTILPSNVISGLGHKAPSDKLNIAGIGIGGVGNHNLKELKSENIVALCDVDWGYSRVMESLKHTLRRRNIWDLRKMYDEMGKSIDAVIIATADHTHALTCCQCHNDGQACLSAETFDPHCLRVTAAYKTGCKA